MSQQDARSQGDQAGQLSPETPLQRRIRLHNTPTAERTLQRLTISAGIVANGGTMTDAAALLNMDRHALSTLKRTYAEDWERLLAEAQSNAPPKRRAQAQGMPTGAGADVRAGIAKATAAIAAGRTLNKAAEFAGTSRSAMRDWQRRYPDLWQTALDNAIAAQVDVIRQQAGTDALLNDVDTFVRSAALCDRWTQQQGESLFPAGKSPTLATFYETYYCPNCMPDARPRTREKYEGIVRLWCYITGDPPLAEITPAVLVKFRDCVAQRRGKKPGSRTSPNSVRGILKHIQAIIDKAGPPARRNRDAAGLIDNPPYVKPPRPTHKVPSVVTSEHIEDVYLAAVAATLPRIEGIKPPAWWKALLVTAYNTGLRRESLFSLRMDNVRWGDCQLELQPDQMKTAVGLRLPLNSTVMEHLQGIRTDRELLFPWPHSTTHFYTVLYRIQAAAGIAAGDRFALHALRRTAATLLWETSPQAAQLVLGHETLKTAQQHYVNGRGIVAAALAAMPQPAAFGGETAGAQ